MRFLLDPCTFLWATQGPDELSAPALERLRDPTAEFFLSSVSAWEIAVKCAAGRLPLHLPTDQFVREGRVALGVASLPVSEDAALVVARLPAFHRDPFDRMLVAQAIAEGMTVVTPDRAIRQYPVNTLW